MIPLFPYQDIGVEALVSRERYGLHDVPGIGKTAQIIRAADKIEAKRGICIVPAKLRHNWIKEFRAFSLRPLRVANGQTIYDFVAWKRGRFNVLVTSYEQGTKWAQEVYDDGEIIDFVAFDEAHYLKNSGSKRTLAMLGPHLNCTEGGLARWSQYVWHVAGTPMSNDPLDIYTFLRMCDATTLNQPSFIRRYFYSDMTAYGSRQSVRPDMLQELTYLIDNNRIRRTKKQVGFQLPPIFLTSAVVDGDTKPIMELLADYPGLEHSIVDALEAGGLSFLDAQHVMRLRRLIGEAKAVPYGYILRDELLANGGEKRIVFGNHVQALVTVRDILVNHGINAVLVNGLITDKQAQAAIDAFQGDPRVQCFIGNMRAAGLGSTLTAANEIDILESDWAPATNAQAIMRAHRIGQHRNVYARFITLANSFDVSVNRIVARKVRAIAEIEGERMNAMADVDEE